MALLPLLLAILVVPWHRHAAAAPAGDKIKSLPGYGTPATDHYSGYLDVSTQQGEVHFHYWLTTSQSPTAATDPLVLWLNVRINHARPHCRIHPAPYAPGYGMADTQDIAALLLPLLLAASCAAAAAAHAFAAAPGVCCM
jgi:hypothetical protein